MKYEHEKWEAYFQENKVGSLEWLSEDQSLNKIAVSLGVAETK